MPKVRGEISNLINGVSQQAESLKLPTQSKIDLNGYPLVVDGLVKRPPTRHSAKIGSSDIDADAFSHTYIRDQTEKYTVAIESDRTLRVWDLNGNQKTVNVADRTERSLDGATTAATGTGYQVITLNADTSLDVVTTGISGDTVIVEESTDAAFTSPTTKATITTNTTTAVTITSGRYYRAKVSVYSAGTINVDLTWGDGSYLDGLTAPEDELGALTLADYTWVTNKSKIVAQRTDTKAARPYEAIFHVITGNYGKYYRIFIDGTEQATYQTPDGAVASHSNNIDTINIANELYNDLVTNGFNTGDWTVARYHSTIYLKNVSTDFTVKCEDGNSNRSMKAIKDYVTNFSDLPNYNTEGFTVRVAGSDGKEEDDYWVEFEWSNGTDSEGTYKETVEPGSKLGYDPFTMPHQLVRETDGTFTWQSAAFTDRVAGNEETIPDPSFVGQAIEDITFHRKRLGFLAKENVIYSAVGEFYQFYRSTLVTLLDTDPIDVAASHIKVSLLRHAVPFQDIMVLFSDQTQFKFRGDDLLTPKTVSARPLTEMSVDPVVKPVANRATIFFVAEGESYSQLYEYFIDNSSENALPEDVSEHVPQYVPANCRHLLASPDLDLLLVYSDDDPDALYVYKQHIKNNEKLQSAFVQWQFPDVDKICSMVMDKQWVVMIVKRGSEHFIERINLERGQEENINLDRRVEIGSGSYDAGTDETTFSAAYTLPATYSVVTKGDGNEPEGVELTPKTPGTLVFSGDYSADTIYVGIEYNFTHRFSTPYYRDSRRYRNQIAITDGRLQVISMSINFDKTAFFEVEVTLEGRDKITYTYTGQTVGDPDTLTGSLIKDTGKFTFPVMSRNDRVTIDIVNNTWRPCAFTSAQWRGIFNPHTREL